MSEENDAITEHVDGRDEAIQNDSDNLECADDSTIEESEQAVDAGQNQPSEDMRCDTADEGAKEDSTGDNAIQDEFIKLEATLDHDALNDMAKQIIEHFKDNDSLEIDASALEDANTACIQAFVSMNRYAQSNSKTLRWISPSESFVESFNTLGLYSEMMQMEMA